MTTYSLLIKTDSLQELHAMLGVFLEATRSPRQAKEKDKGITREDHRKARESSLARSCAFCGRDLGYGQTPTSELIFCNPDCEFIWNWKENEKKKMDLAKGSDLASKISDDMKVPPEVGKSDLGDSVQSCAYCKAIQDHIQDCLRSGLEPGDILNSLRARGVKMSPAELAECLEELA